MKKYLIILFLFCTKVYSQNIVITSEQLKTANLIFAEHQMLSETLPLLENKISNLELINKSWEHTDSIRKIQLSYYENILEDKSKTIEDLNKSIKRKQNTIKYGSVGSCIIIVLCLLLK